MALLRIAAVLAAFAAMASAAATGTPSSESAISDSETMQMNIGDQLQDAMNMNNELDVEESGHALSARGGGHNNHYYDYTYCYKWRRNGGYCKSGYVYYREHNNYRCSPYGYGYYYKPCAKVCCEYYGGGGYGGSNNNGGGSGYY